MSALAAAAVAVCSGCVIEVPAERRHPCADIRCSIDGYCTADAQCKCKPGFVGDPYARYGCQPLHPHNHCQTTCGLNAYCENAVCRCVDGFVAVCGTGDCLHEGQLCDGVDDCANAVDEDPEICYPMIVQEYLVTDQCDDATPVIWRLWSGDRDWVWPSPDDAFVTRGFGVLSSELIECRRGELVCFGASLDGAHWGVGADGSRSCDDCCYTCAGELVDLGYLGCP
jgi:hypothetical protein